MTGRQQIAAVIISIIVFALIIYLLRTRRLREEYSWIWFLLGSAILLLALCYPILQFLTVLIGAVLPTTTLFLFGLICMVFICLQFSVRLSGLSTRLKNLTQEIALLRGKMESLQGEPDKAGEKKS